MLNPNAVLSTSRALVAQTVASIPTSMPTLTPAPTPKAPRATSSPFAVAAALGAMSAVVVGISVLHAYEAFSGTTVV